ncbi:hypothetical protein ACSTHP_00280, partial [Vibrio parahaemolyticus]
QVSSTSEELASQAEQLQSTISFFRIEESGRKAKGAPQDIDRAVGQLRAKAAKMAAVDRGGKAPRPSRRAPGRSQAAAASLSTWMMA